MRRLLIAGVVIGGLSVLLHAQSIFPSGGGACTGYTGNIEVGLNTLHFVSGCLSTVD